MKEAGTTKNGLLTSKPAISLSYSLTYGSTVEYFRNSSEMDSISVRRSFSVISDFISIKKYLFGYQMSRINVNPPYIGLLAIKRQIYWI